MLCIVSLSKTCWRSLWRPEEKQSLTTFISHHISEDFKEILEELNFCFDIKYKKFKEELRVG
jgi:hypothetical protein